MEISEKAKRRLKKLLPAEASGFSVTGFIGTCRGSTPILKPAQKAQPDQITIESNGLTFFVNPDVAERFRDCALDHDGSFFGKGLTASWPQCNECACHS